MYLEKLEIQGFKSFANKNTLIFPGMLDKSKRGITCMVGPNGAGKSNIADSIRWVLGEQSMKILRGKKSQDIIFSGSNKKAGAGMSEVSLFLNNEDRKAPVDYSQIVLTRRIFRDGNSEYILNNNKVRLSDVQILLAKSKFGQKTYSVIGQGMVEGFLNTSLAERKEFFDEATGVKQFQIKRDESLNKLKLSYENLIQAEMLLSEIEPRLRSLTRQVNKLQRREKIEAELKNVQLGYYGKNWHEINNKFNAINKKFLEIEKVKIERERKLDALNGKLAQMEKENSISRDFNLWQNELSSLQTEKESITKELAKLEAKMEVKLEAAGKFDLSWLLNKGREIKKEVEKIKNQLESFKKEADYEKNRISNLIKEKNIVSVKINEINNNFHPFKNAAEGEEIKGINASIKTLILKIESAEREQDKNKIKNIINEVKLELKKLLELSKNAGAGSNYLEAQKNLAEITRKQEKTLLELNEKSLSLSIKLEQMKLLEEKRAGLEKDLNEIEKKLNIDSGPADAEARQKKLKTVEVKISEIKNKISAFSREEEAKRAAFFEAQKNIQALQNEINAFGNELNEIKISSARYETRLEDFESEIRHNFGDLNIIKKHKVEGLVDNEAALEKIGNLKRQLDLIGGIDPEIEKEYIETKERYDFLSGQTKDLISAIKSLERIIKELDLTIKERFDKEFSLISKKFEEYFKILFSGGQAKIIKVIAQEEDDKSSSGLDEAAGDEKNIEEDLMQKKNQPTEEKSKIDIKKIKFLQKHNATGLAGVEIQATPPGKKIKSVSMLSGGERALTAIALICAIISANPSPFVVLDEVDAALDEANSERLAKILDDLSYKTQFIIITHNRATMRRANILYGVTMRDDGVSKLLSIKLNEAEKK